MLQAARVGAPWMWTLPLANMKIERRRTATRRRAMAAMAAFAKSCSGNKAQRFRRAELTGSRRGTLWKIETKSRGIRLSD
jgi:hypothetical protein